MEKKRDKMEKREWDEHNDIKCILNSKHRPHYEKISTWFAIFVWARIIHYLIITNVI